MAEMVVSAFFSLFFDKLASEAMSRIARARGIESELKKLKRLLIQIKNLLYDASRKELTDEAVKEWLDGLQHLAYDIDDVFDELSTEAIERELNEKSGSTISNKVRKLIPTCCTNFLLSSRIHGKLDDIATKLQELVDAKNNLGLSGITNEIPKVRRYKAGLVDTSVIVGRKGDKEALIQKLLGGNDVSSNQNFSIVPIVGMGGVGKTTLARLLYDEMEVKDHFEVRAWVCVSDEFDVSSISNVIYQSVTGETREFKDLNLLQEALREKLTNKLFIIVLDDVWSESYDDWDKLVSPFLVGAPGSRIIITTRKEQLLKKLGYAHIDPLSSLSHDDAMCLFSQHALGVDNFDSHPTLRPHGERLVRKCDGLPLALRSLGRLLRTKTDEEEWEELLDSEIWKLGKKDEIIPALRLSYNDLSSSLKQLFAYCSLFPKDYLFDKEELILLWMAEGFLHHSVSTTSKSMQRLGLEYFEELLSRSFFQHSSDDKSLFVMHDLMNDLAMSVAREFFSRLDVDKKKEDLQKHRHVSFVCEDYMIHEKFKPLIGAKSLRTFLALSVGVVRSWEKFYLSNKVVNDLLQELPMLRVLSLSNLSISEVPEVVGGMMHLRYLNLSNTEITHLPESVCNLYNLQTLIVSECHSLTKLPKSFSKLQNLQHFDFRGTPRLENMPLEIGELKNLRTFSKIIVGGENGFSITELKNMQNLHGEVSISGLRNVHNVADAREANLSQKKLSVLEFDWGGSESALSKTETHEEEILNELKPKNDTLKQLTIKSYEGIDFPNWVGDPSFLRLTKVSLDGCQKCTSLPRLGELPSLKELSISRMHRVRDVGLEFLGTGLAFPSLEVLSFQDMLRWRVWSTKNSHAMFPCLKELRIQNCSNLLEVSLEALPSLRFLRVNECGPGVLTSLVTVASSLTTLQIDRISELTDELWRVVTESLGSVKVLMIKRCHEITYLWESESVASKILGNLMFLAVSNCNSLEYCICLNSIEWLSIRSCDSITSVSFPTQNLKSIIIGDCENLSFHKEESGKDISWPSLTSFTHFARLVITECPNMESFPDHELPNLTSVIHITISKCTGMDDSFPRGLWPPNLHRLEIGGLKKPISEWGSQNFPTSLTDLELCGGPYDDVRNFGELSHLFPSSLTSLSISGFEKLESVSMGLQHLTSLQHLSIVDCPETIDLPEMLLPSLLSLKIDGCRNLKEKSSSGGTYWPLISLIPRVDTLQL